MRRSYWFFGWLCSLFLLLFGCSEDPPINRVGVNVVDKSIFEGSWYLLRTVIDVDYEAAGAGTFPGDIASDFVGGGYLSTPRIRWVIDEDFLYAYRDYELLAGGNGEPETPGDYLGHPVAAFRIESHFDIRRQYNPSTGEELNVIEENATDKRWYERKYMRVDWSRNMLPGYYGQIHEIYEVFGLYTREATDLYVQNESDFPDSWQPRFDFMSCSGPGDTSEGCTEVDRDHTGDYDEGQLYHMSFVTQDLLSPGMVPDPFTGDMVNWCASAYSDSPSCNTLAVYVRTSFMRVSDKRQYEPVNWTDSRFDRHGYFRLEQPTFDRSSGPTDPAYQATDFVNYNVTRHNIWQQWHDADGDAIPYAEREVRPVVWHTTPELPAHLVKPSFQIVSEWNRVFMGAVRALRGERAAEYPSLACQTADPDAYCYCTRDDDGALLNPTCPGLYDPFQTPEEAEANGAVEAYRCHVEVVDGSGRVIPADRVEPDLDDPEVGARVADADFNGWFGARMVGDECVNVLRVNACNRASIAANGGTADGLECQERGDLRYKFLSYVNQPGTGFLGVATMRADPVSGEIIAGDANIGGPALDAYRTSALLQYDLLNGNLTDQELIVGENVRDYLEGLNDPELPAVPRIDFIAGVQNAAAPLPSDARELRQRMDTVMDRATKLRGPEGRSAIYSDRRRALRGSDIERRLLGNEESLLLAGIQRIPEGQSAAQLSDAVLDRISPFRSDATSLLRDFSAAEARIGGAAVTLPNEYVDDSVASYVRERVDWPRARLEIALDRALFYETELHELGHCFGLRHDFGASADVGNYPDDYYLIDEQFPLPDPATYDQDGTAGLSPTEQIAFEDAFTEARHQRELAGIDRWMSSSVMEYTANWYQRVTTTVGRYDEAAIRFGYGDLVEAYDNADGRDRDDITPITTPRTQLKYYHGGEVCRVDADCPFALDGARSSELLPSNREMNVAQRCVANPRGAPGDRLCTSFDDDIVAIGAGDSPEVVPVHFRFCSDERAAGGGTEPGTLGWCNRFDEGDSYREIVRNVAESYERQYLFTNFRRYRAAFNISEYIYGSLIGRRFVILQNVYQNLLYQYAADPAYRDDEGAFGFYDEFLATADILNFYARVLASPNVGGYSYDDATRTYSRVDETPTESSELAIGVGMGRYSSSVYQAGLSGIQRVERIGTFYDKWFTLRLLAERGGPAYTRDVPFYSNFYDLFPLEMQQIFDGMIRNAPEEYMPRLDCNGPRTPTCEDPRLIYMDFYRGDCLTPGSTTCRPDPATDTYAGLPIVDGGASFLLQFYAMIYGLAEFPVFFDTTFQNQLFVCVEGQGDCYAPGEEDELGVDYVRFTSDRYGKSFLAWQVEPSGAVVNQTSIGFAMVRQADDSAFLLDVLQKLRGDAGGTPLDPETTLTEAERDRVHDLEYQLPRTNRALADEIDRLDGLVGDLESFFNQLIQVEREMGVRDYL